MDEEIAHAPKAPHELEERLAEHHSTSPADSGGDIDAECMVTWQKGVLARLSRFVDGHPFVAMGGFVGAVLGMAALALAAVGGVVVGVVGVLV